MEVQLLKPRQVDLLLDLSFGRSKQLAKEGKIPYVTLPDGSIRFDKQVIDQLIHPEKNRYLSLEALAKRLGLPEKYLNELAKAGAIPFFNIKSQMQFDLVGVVDSLARLNPKDVDISKAIFLYERLKGIYSGTAKSEKS